MRRRTRPLFAIDPGWLYLAAGLAVCAACVLIPAQRDLHGLEQRVATLRAEEKFAYDRLTAYASFLEDLEEPDFALVRRLSVSQLNLVPEGTRPVVLSDRINSTVHDWIDSSVTLEPANEWAYPESKLTRLVMGRHRLWVLAAGTMCIFVSLLLGPGRALMRKDDVEGVDDDRAGAVAAPEWNADDLVGFADEDGADEDDNEAWRVERQDDRGSRGDRRLLVAREYGDEDAALLTGDDEETWDYEPNELWNDDFPFTAGEPRGAVSAIEFLSRASEDDERGDAEDDAVNAFASSEEGALLIRLDEPIGGILGFGPHGAADEEALAPYLDCTSAFARLREAEEVAEEAGLVADGEQQGLLFPELHPTPIAQTVVEFDKTTPAPSESADGLNEGDDEARYDAPEVEVLGPYLLIAHDLEAEGEADLAPESRVHS